MMVGNDTKFDTGATSVHWAELARLRAIESAAREYRTAWQHTPGQDNGEWVAKNCEARSRLFALLDSTPLDPAAPPPDDSV